MRYISIGVFAAFLTFVITSPLKKKYVVNESCVRTVGVTITAWVTGQTSHAPTSLIVQKKADNSQALGSVEVPSISSITSLPSISSGTSSTPAPIVAYIAPTTTSTFTIPSPVVASIATVASAPASRQTSSAVQKQADNLISTTSPLLETSSTLASIAPNIASTLAAVASATAFAQSLSTSNASGSGACGQIGGACSGDITVYDTTAGLTPEVFQKSGFGACGWLNNGTYENVFALAHGMMGDQSNGNPYCGRMATITLDGKTATGKLVDKCPACGGQSIDLSDHLFADLGATTNTGRYHDVKWSFTT